MKSVKWKRETKGAVDSIDEGFEISTWNEKTTCADKNGEGEAPLRLKITEKNCSLRKIDGGQVLATMIGAPGRCSIKGKVAAGRSSDSRKRLKSSALLG